MVTRPVIISIIPSTTSLGSQIAELLDGEHVISNGKPLQQIAAAFSANRAVIGICASAILIRAIAPYMQDKATDAPVIAVSPDGMNIVPLLAGHGGANMMAAKIASLTGGIAAITTASDTNFNIALDEPPRGLVLANKEHVKGFVSRLLDGASLSIIHQPPTQHPASAGKTSDTHSTESQLALDWLKSSTLPVTSNGELQIIITTQNHPTSETCLVYHPQTICIGVGCERGTPAKQIAKLVRDCLGNISPNSIACICSLDLKSDEPGINHLADSYNVPARFFAAEELKGETGRIANPSQIVLSEVGTPSVAEAACLAASGPDGRLLVEKTRSKRATCAIAISPRPLTPPFPGTSRGKISVVGIGPGSRKWRSPHAVDCLLSADDWVGYGLYLDLVADLSPGKNLHRFDLGKEEIRVRHAFKLAGAGKNVALVCSGDAGIYAMAALTYEVLDSGSLNASEQRAAIETVPGISAFQAAAARAGAIIGHDFCAISLSDLLTQWQTIEKRLHAASAGDFTVAFYNPRSLKRTDQLEKAINILKPNRHDDTPVIIASNLGRPQEQVKTVRLADFKPEQVDMLTIVLVGSSQSKIITRGDGNNYCYTPRGYANKEPAQ